MIIAKKPEGTTPLITYRLVIVARNFGLVSHGTSFNPEAIQFNADFVFTQLANEPSHPNKAVEKPIGSSYLGRWEGTQQQRRKLASLFPWPLFKPNGDLGN